ncbi:DEAD/DEAH box helicase family protein [Paenibacillus foliorum]|uniref:DEAD/DEAH box helicase family protein n=1 Tax=Paenibacillus foliorum TaxID=2654974 RepID=UPI0014928F90|nr:DEAD/DEAH box helicase family protein [Paenibacillus foliorum]
MSNFKFLSVKWPVLANLGEIAERNLHHDPNTTIFKLRLYGEQLVGAIFAYEGKQEPRPNNQVTKINFLYSCGIIPEAIYNFLNDIRKKGNEAAHEGHDSKQDATDLLRATLQLSIWFFRTYEDDQFQPLTFIEPIKVQSSTELKKQLDDLTTSNTHQINLLKEKLDELRLREVSKEETILRRARSIVALSAIRLTEKDSRKLIGEQLTKLGWFCPEESYSQGARPTEGINSAIAKWPLNDKYMADYALFLGTKLVAFIDTKSQGRDPYSQLGRIIKNATNVIRRDTEDFVTLNNDNLIPFVFAANGLLKINSGIWFYDTRKNTNIPRIISSWYSPQGFIDLLRVDKDLSVKRLEHESIDYLSDFRDYQIKAIKKIEEALLESRNNLLVNMASGTGMTRMAVGLIYRLLKTEIFKRILFLVDRISVGHKAYEAFRETKLEGNFNLTDIYNIECFDSRNFDLKTRVSIETVQSIVRNLENPNSVFSVDTYDCIVIDGLYWSGELDNDLSYINSMFINKEDYQGKYMSAFDYFDATKIVLTTNSEKNLEYLFGEPVFTYLYENAISDGHLLGYKVTKMGLLSEQKYGKGFLTVEEVQLDKLILTEKFVRSVMVELIEHIDPLSNKKTIVFASSNDHAELIVNILRELLVNKYENLDKNTVVQITSSVDDVQQKIRLFENERLPNIAVSVDILTIGINVPEVCNLVFLRQVKSKMLFENMLLRASRLSFKIDKQYYNVFDAVGVFETLG